MFKTEQERDQAKRGWAILKEVTPPAWWRQPAPHADFQVFRKHHTLELLHNYSEAKEKSGVYPHYYDKRAARLGAAAGVVLGVGAPIYTTEGTFSNRPGLWHITIRNAPQTHQDAILPPLYKRIDTWQYTPIVQLLSEQGYTFDVVEAYTFPEAHQALRPFYERMKELRGAALTSPALADVKVMYTKTFGMLAHLPKEGASPTFVYRPDWYYTLVAHEKANIYRQLFRVWQQEGQAPRMVHTDCLWYEREVTSLPMGPGIGQYVHNK